MTVGADGNPDRRSLLAMLDALLAGRAAARLGAADELEVFHGHCQKKLA